MPIVRCSKKALKKINDRVKWLNRENKPVKYNQEFVVDQMVDGLDIYLSLKETSEEK